MKVAIIGSRSVSAFDLGSVLPADTTEIITGGAQGMDAIAQAYASSAGIPCTVIRPDYRRYGKGAPLRRNEEIIRMADLVIAVWDGASRGTAHVIRRCGELKRLCIVHHI